MNVRTKFRAEKPRKDISCGKSQKGISKIIPKDFVMEVKICWRLI